MESTIIKSGVFTEQYACNGVAPSKPSIRKGGGFNISDIALSDKIFAHLSHSHGYIEAVFLVQSIHKVHEIIVMLLYEKSTYEWQPLKECQGHFVILNGEMNHLMYDHLAEVISCPSVSS